MTTPTQTEYGPADGIDWSKPIEHIDGTPLVFFPGEKSPDDSGDYYLVRADGKPFTRSQWDGGSESMIIRPDGSRWGDRSPEPFVRNTADIIGYTPKPCADEWQPKPATDALKECVQLYRASQPDFVLCERTVRQLMASMPDAAYGSHDWRRGVNDCLTEMKALLPKKDRAEELVEAWYDWRCKHRGELVVKRPEIDEVAKTFAEFLIAQGEIRG